MTTSVVQFGEARAPISVIRGQRPRLSILLLSRADEFELERAIEVVSDAAYSLNAQVVLVREEATGSEREHIQRIVQQYQIALAWVGAGSDRSAMTDEGLRYVTGDIVTCRDDDRVQNGEWLSVFSRFAASSARRGTELDVSPAALDERSGGGRPDRPSRATQPTKRWIEAASESVS
jgi:hypothetical protein